MKKVAFIVPSTTNKRDEWKNIKDTFLWNILMKSLEDNPPVDCDITLFIGYDEIDRVLSLKEQRLTCNAIYQNFKIEWISFNDDYKGKPTWIWNELGRIAIDKGFDYIKVLGDDIVIPNDRAWLNSFINKLKKNDDIGFSSGWSNNNAIPTQFLIHRTHIDIFGFVYPQEIKNWGCDDWLYEVYPDKYRNWNKNIHLLNVGGEPRYEVEFNKRFINAIVKRYKPKFNRFLSNKNK